MVSKLRYIVLAACFLVNFIILGFAVGLGVIFVELVNLTGTSRAQMAFMQSLCGGLIFAGSLIASPFVRKFGTSFCCIVGGVVAGSSVMVASFLSNIPSLIVLIGAVTGFSLCFCHLVSYVTISEVFYDRKGFGEAVIMAGGGLGSFCMPMVNRLLLEEFGWRGTFLLLSGMLYNICLFAVITHTFKRLCLQSEHLEKQSDVQNQHQSQNNQIEDHTVSQDDFQNEKGDQNEDQLEKDIYQPRYNIQYGGDYNQSQLNDEAKIQLDGVQSQLNDEAKIQLDGVQGQLNDEAKKQLDGVQSQLNDKAKIQLEGVQSQLNDEAKIQLDGVQDQLNDEAKKQLDGVQSQLNDEAELQLDDVQIHLQSKCDKKEDIYQPQNNVQIQYGDAEKDYLDVKVEKQWDAVNIQYDSEKYNTAGKRLESVAEEQKCHDVQIQYHVEDDNEKGCKLIGDVAINCDSVQIQHHIELRNNIKEQDDNVAVEQKCRDVQIQHDNVGVEQKCRDVQIQLDNVAVEQKCRDVQIQHDNVAVEQKCHDVQIQHDSVAVKQKCCDVQIQHDNVAMEQKCRDVQIQLDNVAVEQICSDVQIQLDTVAVEQICSDVHIQHDNEHRQRELNSNLKLKQSDDIQGQHQTERYNKHQKEGKLEKGGIENLSFRNSVEIQHSDCPNQPLYQHGEPFSNKMANESSNKTADFQHQSSKEKTSLPREPIGCQDMTSFLYTYLGLQVFKNKLFRIFLLEQFPMWLSLISELFLLVDIVVEKGYDLTTGSYFLSAFSIASVIGNLCGGCVMSVFHIQGLSLAGVAACCASCAVLATSFASNFVLLMLLVVTTGFLLGLLSVCNPVIVLELLPVDVYGSSLGLLFGTSGCADVISGPLGGVIRDVSGSYNLMLYGNAGILLCSGLIKIYLARLNSKETLNENGLYISTDTELSRL